MSFDLWLGFLLAAILIALTPGPGAVTSMSAGLQYGYWLALRAIMGLQAALLVQLAIVAAGLGALLAVSGFAFDLVRMLGAGYLVWLGLRKWSAPPVTRTPDAALGPVNGLFVQGLLVNLSNPKAILFMAALVPQFVEPSGEQWPQFLLIGATMCTVDTIVMSGYALLVSRLRHWLCDERALRLQNRVFGACFISAGVLLAASGRA